MAEETIRKRRTNAELAIMKDACKRVIAEEGRLTVRHMFYRLVSMGIIPKTENAYDNLSNHLTNWRKVGDLPFSAFIDGTRWYHKSASYNTMMDALEESNRAFKINIWRRQPVYLELWVEKDAIMSIVSPVTREFDIPVFAVRGQASMSAIFEMYIQLRDQRQAGKEIRIKYIGDHDPYGKSIPTAIQRTLKETFDFDVDIEWIAITKDQVEKYNLPMRPTKGNSKSFEGDSIEVDALNAQTLRQIVEEAITKHIDMKAWNAELAVQDMEKNTLNYLLSAVEIAQRHDKTHEWAREMIHCAEEEERRQKLHDDAMDVVRKTKEDYPDAFK